MENSDNKTSLLDKWKNRSKKASTLNNIEKAPEGIDVPLSSGQKRLWFLQQLHPENAFYNLSKFYEFEGKLDATRLKEAILAIFNKHKILRAYTKLENGIPTLKISENCVLKINELDFRKKNIEEAEYLSKQLMDEQALTKFDLTTAPLIKVSLIKKNATKHILFLTLHHIIADQWSMDVIIEELAFNYINSSQTTNTIPHSNELDFIDYAFWQNTKNNYDELIKYWQKKLSGIQNLNLPLDYERPLVPSFKGKRITHEFSREISTKTLELSKQLQVTPFILNLSLFYILLYNYSRQDDITIGIPFSNRSDKRLEKSIGLFIETLVLRTNVIPTNSVKDFIKMIQKMYLNTVPYKDLPFDTLVKELSIERSLSSNPIFQVMFVYSSTKSSYSFGEDLELIINDDYNIDVSKFDLTLFITEREGILSSIFEYSTDLFDESTINRFQEYFKSLLENIVENSKLSIGDIPKLTEHENKLFFKPQKEFQPEFNSYKSIHKIIEGITASHPNKQAVTFNNTSLTYNELNTRANTLAQNILNLNLQHNAVVGLCIDRSLDMIVGMLGILKAGGCYLPLDPDYPKERIDFILNDSNTQLVITQSQNTHFFQDIGCSYINIEDSQSNSKKTIEFPEITKEDLAYIIYTSGSTGKPKGVPISHGNIISSTASRLEFYDTNPEAFLLMSSISFDSSKVGILWTLCTGGNLVIAEKRIEQDIDKISTLIKEESITHTLMLPSLYNLILDYVEAPKLKSLNTVMVAGEACNMPMCKKHFNIFPEVNLYNEYGPTEASVWCIAHKITPNNFYLKNVPIGKPIANSEVYILDDNMKQVPIGVTGEIHVGGSGLSKGYINREDLTNKAFINSPFKQHKKLYKTGDLGKFKNDGTIQFLGRKDQQIKIRGFRIELSEIENSIKKYSNSINETIVVVDGNDEVNIPNFNDVEDETYATLLKNLEKTEIEDLFNSIENLSSEEKAYILNQI